jgi:hypothetical protein
MVSEWTNVVTRANSCDTRLLNPCSLPHILSLWNKAVSSSLPRLNEFDAPVDGNESYPSLEGPLEYSGVLCMGRTSPLFEEV